ncbi:heterokaryon incompatibility protein Het-C [Phlyctema vagabunda]|uniref:Heterokaryon incompatibility protein Het-C n=1 Tax=Phlyctema vagabunda TaxID=108571 RepID=A0ABR4PME3_9HELO
MVNQANMALSTSSFGSIFLVTCIILLVLPSPAAAFGAGNIPSIAQIEGQNFRHGGRSLDAHTLQPRKTKQILDIEDMLKTIAFIKGHKWTSMMVKRVYFGNWLRDYSQAVDVGSLKGVSAPTIRILVWVLSFLSFGYATGEFEVTEERLGVYRPEEHIDNPKGYADDLDARSYDPRLRGPIQPVELEIDRQTAMKNYIANESGGWATSAGYVKYSFSRSIHFGRLYTNGSRGSSGKEEDLCEALRCLGQGLHCMEDFGAHTNYCELALRELGFHQVFPHTGTETEMNVHGKRIFPLVTGTFGAVDFLHSVLGEATDHFTQTEVEEMDIALKGAEQSQNSGYGGALDFASLISQVPGMGGGLASTARSLQESSAAKDQENHYSASRGSANEFSAYPGSAGGPPGPGIPGMSPDFDPIKTAAQIYPILEFRDKVVRAISATIAKIPGLEALVEKISETLTIFIMSLLAPFVRPIIEAVSDSLKKGSTGVVEASANQQFEPWNDPHCTNPTHSMLSKDHFSNALNGCAGRVASTILQYVAPRVIYAWENTGVPVDEVMNDILRVFHHPALRDESLEVHRNMFNTVRKWVDEQPDRHSLNNLLSSASVKAGHNHKGAGGVSGAATRDIHDHGSLGGHGKTAGSIWSEIQTRDLGSMEGRDGKAFNSYMSPSPQPGSPGTHHNKPDYGYHQEGHSHQNNSRPQSSQGGYLNPGPQYQGSYSGGPPPQSYQQQQPPYGEQSQYGGGYQQPQQPPYGGGGGGYQQPPYGGPPPGQWGGPSGFQGGPPPPGGPYGPPQGGYPGQGYPGQGYPGQGYPPQQPPYGGGGYGGY